MKQMKQMRLEDARPDWEPQDKTCPTCGGMREWEQGSPSVGFLHCGKCKSFQLRRES